jgi:hypothetical protein
MFVMALRRGCFILSLVSVACGPAVSVPADLNGSSSDTAESGSITTTAAPPATTSTPTTGPSTSDDEPATTELPESSTTTTASSASTSDTSVSTDGSTTGESAACAAIDILFVIDSSENFAGVRDRYLAALVGLVDELTTTFADQSLHIGVLPTDYYWPHEPTSCDTPGDLLTHTVTAACLPDDGPRFATSEDDLAEVLPCLLDVGLESGFHYPVTNTIEALSDDQQAPGACNEGFLRDDAVLGIFYVTNDPACECENDDAHPDLVTFWWHDAILAAKNDDPTAVAVTGIVAMNPLDCIFLQVENTNLIEFIDDFGSQGLRGSVCDEDWAPTFSAGIDLLADTCAAWDP